MKITFLGSGSAFTTDEYFQSNILVTAESGKNLLIDCGTDIRFSLNKYGINNSNVSQKIDAVYASHMHSDHIGGLEWLALNSYFCKEPKRPILFIDKSLEQCMWDYTLRGCLEYVEGKVMTMSDYFDCHSLTDGEEFIWENISFTLIKMVHFKTKGKNIYSFALLVRDLHDGATPTNNPEVSFFFTSDAVFQPDIINDVSKKVKYIFHDCETLPFRTLLHAHYEDLCTLPADIKAKMWLYHYQPKPNYNPKNDGFNGFVSKGQEFCF